jgi:hypothetical protein
VALAGIDRDTAGPTVAHRTRPATGPAREGRSRPAGPAGRDALRRQVATLTYREGAKALRPSDRGKAGPTPGFEPAVATGPPARPEGADRDAIRDELQCWYTDTKVAIQAARNQMGRAAERFATFAGSNVRSLKAGMARAGSLATLLFGARGRMANLLAGYIVEAAAKDPGPGLRTEMARRLDAEARTAEQEVAGRYEALHRGVVSAATEEALRKARDAIRAARPGLLPTENQLYRDLLLNLARDAGMHLDGSDFNLRHQGRWWSSLQPSRPFALDGPEVADELNALDRRDPGTRKPFDTERLP